MDESQQQTVLKSIAISSGIVATTNAADLQTSYSVLDNFRTRFDGRVAASILWIQQERLYVDGNVDATVPVKLYAISIIQDFLATGYSKLSENDRLTLRVAVLTAARQLAPLPFSQDGRILGNKVASLLAGLMVRDFPQRWTTFVQDLFSPIQAGGLWHNMGATGGGDDVHIMGLRICLQCLRDVTEDCTDSDFNSKISTKRRNDVLIGLNEVSSQFLPKLFHILEHYAVLAQHKMTLHNMRLHLLSGGRSLATMSPEEAGMYNEELRRKDSAAQIIKDCLKTLAKFAQALPLDWIMGKEPDFTAALLHLLREPSTQLEAVSCLEQLSYRKLDKQQWMRLITHLPQAVSDTNDSLQSEVEHIRIERLVRGARDENNDDNADMLVLQFPFHRVLSRTLALLISSHLVHITNDKQIVKTNGQRYESFTKYLRLLVDMIHHPSGRLASEQISAWISLLRDPQTSKTSMLKPFIHEVLSCYLNQMVKIRWDDVLEGSHPQSALMEASWDDGDDYDAFVGDLRSRASLLFRFLGNVEPATCVTVLNERVQATLSKHGNGEPHDHRDPSNNQLSTASDAVLQFEALYHPMDYILFGLPKWAIVDETYENKSGERASRREQAHVRTTVVPALEQIAASIVNWKPTYLWLRFRRANLIDGLKYFWRYNPASLLNGIDSLLQYLSVPDDWTSPQKPALERQTPFNGSLSGETISLRKKSGVALVSVAKQVPHHLVPWLSQLSEATQRQLADPNLLAPSRMYLYEFLSCIATAVQDPSLRSNFVSDVLSDAVSVITSADTYRAFSSVEDFFRFMGISQAGQDPDSVTNQQFVENVTASFVRLFSAFNQLLSVGKRCNEAAKKRSNGGLPIENIEAASNDIDATSFPDEGCVSLQVLAMNDPFVPLWPKILPSLLKVLDVTLSVWHLGQQARLLNNAHQRFVLAISDDEAYLSKVQDNASGGVFGDGGTAGSVVPGTDRRDTNLVPRWSGWFNELRNTCFQMLGLLSGQRALFSPEIAPLFPQLVSVVANPNHLAAMESRHMTQYLKQFIEILGLACPASLYSSHLGPILRPVMEHIRYRFELTWSPILESNSGLSTTPLFTSGCGSAVQRAKTGGDAWFQEYYARNGLFVGDLDVVIAEAASEKARVEMTRGFSDLLQALFALKGDWALVLANQAKEEQATRRHDPGKLSAGPRNQINGQGIPLNADGTPKRRHEGVVEARKTLRINSICRYLLLEDDVVAGSLLLTVIQCLEYPDAYTVRRCTKICHRLLETAAWSPRYSDFLTNGMLVAATKNIVTEPKWMVGIEWDMINIIRDIICRLVLGQYLQFGGQGPGNQQMRVAGKPNVFEQSRHVAKPLLGGGILVNPNTAPLDLLARLPGLDASAVMGLQNQMSMKRSAKDQKDVLRDLLRIAAQNSKSLDGSRAVNGVFQRAASQESVLNQKKATQLTVHDIPEKLVTHTMQTKQRTKREQPEGLVAFQI